MAVFVVLRGRSLAAIGQFVEILIQLSDFILLKYLIVAKPIFTFLLLVPI